MELLLVSATIFSSVIILAIQVLDLMKLINISDQAKLLE